MKKSRIIQGLMRIGGISEEELYELIKFDLDNGIYFFDIADCYDNGNAEVKLGKVLKAHPELRKQMFIQTKGAIRLSDTGAYYDFSYEHMKEALNDSLKRMGIDYVDSYLFHRPDIFMDNEEVARFVDEAFKEGKIKHIGVSNCSKEMIEYLSTNLKQRIEYNQIQLGVGHMPLIEECFNFNMSNKEGNSRTEDTYFYMKRKGILLQAWSPFLVNFFEGSLFDENKYPEVNKVFNELKDKYHTSKCAIATSFILMLNKDITVITGSLNLDHVKECLDGENITMSKEDWYHLYKSSGRMLP